MRVSDVLAPTTTEVIYRWVATIFKAAVADRLIPASPCIRIALPKRDRSELVPLERMQLLTSGHRCVGERGSHGTHRERWVLLVGLRFRHLGR